MNAFETTNRFLVKFRDPSAAASPRISAPSGSERACRHLCLRAAVSQHRRRPRPGSGRERRRVAGRDGVGAASTTAEAWDHCHDILAADSSVVAVEPDLVQRWPVGPTDTGQKFGARAGGPHPQDIGGGYSGVADDNYWFRNSTHNQMDSAFAQTSGGAGVRIAHLDTGYDPTHKSVPKHLRADLAHNFVDADKPNDATDRSEGAPSTISATAAARSAFWPARPCRASSRSAARRTPRSCRFGSPTGSCCSATAPSRRGSTTSTACARSEGRASMS